MMVTYPLKFKAAILEKIGQPLVLDEIEFAGPLLAGQVLVKLSYSGICGKQVEELEGLGGPDPFLPHLLGHEGSGEVLDFGPGVNKVKKGDMVVLHWRKGSGINSVTPLYTRKGVRVNAGWVTTFNEYAVVSENRVTAIPKDSDLLIAALLGCVVTTGVGVVFNAANVQSYDTIAVFGCGGVGLCAVQAAMIGHPRKLIAVDVNKKALDMAKEFGATEVIDSSKEDTIKRILSVTAGRGLSKVLVCTGNSKAIEAAIESTSIPGECFLVGVPVKGSRVSIDPHAVMHERNIRGALGGGSFPDRDILAYLALQRERVLHLDKLISYLGEFDKINEAIKTMRGDTPGRCVVKF